MALARLFRKASPDLPLEELPLDSWTDELAQPGWIWIDLERPERSDLQPFIDHWGWDRITVEDVFDYTPSARYADHGDYVFVAWHVLGPPAVRVDTAEVDAYLGTNYLVTIRQAPITSLDDLIEEFKTSPPATEGGPDRMLARVADDSTDRFTPLLDALEERTEALEDEALLGDPRVIGEVQALRRDATRLRRIVAPQREVMLALSREESTPLIDRRARLRFAHVYDQLFRMVESLDGARLLLAAVLETYRSAVAEATNRVMKVLTVFSAIVLPLTLVAGIYGMNFDYMPELRWPVGYFLALGVMAVTAIGLWTWFVRKGFVGGPRLQDLPKAVGLGLWHVAALPVRGLGAVVKTLGNAEGRRGALDDASSQRSDAQHQ